jgi:YHS domain-containing protein
MTPICPACGCSLVRLGIDRASGTAYDHEGEELLFCCSGCVDVFKQAPERHLEELRDWVVCPTCLAEKPKKLTVAIDYLGRRIHFCRCPGCVTEFRRRPDELLARLAA